MVTGARLREIVEENLTHVFCEDAFVHSGDWFDGFSGLDLGLDLEAADGNRVSSTALSATATPIGPTDQVHVAGCTRPFDAGSTTTLCSYDGFTGVADIIDPSMTRINVTDSAATQFWPVDA